MRGSTNAQPSVPVMNSIVYQRSASTTINQGVNAPLSWTCTATGSYIVTGYMETHGAPEASYVLGLGVDSTNGNWSQSTPTGAGDVRVSATRMYYLQQGQTVYLNIFTANAISAPGTTVELTIARLT